LFYDVFIIMRKFIFERDLTKIIKYIINESNYDKVEVLMDEMDEMYESHVSKVLNFMKKQKIETLNNKMKNKFLSDLDEDLYDLLVDSKDNKMSKKDYYDVEVYADERHKKFQKFIGKKSK